ncbi:MAG: hypothetical protein DI596_14045 [Azospira oryzae]|nr:MAG: hypothetical protein DI596_14045 [Azospira oryzae]PZP76612.1 MAG: hypothetical protein DI593_14045 [Azospira oryzae]
MMEFGSPEFWIAVLQIIAIDILLGGDNAVVIALACRKLPPRQRKLGIFWGVFGAIALRVILIFFALTLLKIPFLKLVGAALLLWIGIKLVLPERDEGGHEIDASTSLMGAIKTIIVADAVMSLDNVIAIAAASKDSIALVVFGLVVSIPIIVFGSQLVLKLMDRFPIVILGGGALLGWIAGDMAVSDVAIREWVAQNMEGFQWVAAVAGAALVVIVGKLLALRTTAEPAVDLASQPADPPEPR